jgi:WD40 repeat protein
MRILQIRRGSVQHLAYGRAGRLLLTASHIEPMRVWDLTTFTESRVIEERTPGRLLLFWMLIRGGRPFLEANGYWPASEELPLAVDPRPEHVRALPTEFCKIGWLCCTPDGSGYLEAGYGQLWNTDRRLATFDFAGRCLRTYTWREPSPPTRAGFTPDGKLLALHAGGSAVMLLDGLMGKPLGALEHPSNVLAMAISPDGRRLGTAAGRTVRLWDLESRQLMQAFPAFRASCEALAFSPDGRLLAAGSREGRVRLWDTTSFRESADHDWGFGDVNELRFSPDGLTCAAACQRKAVVVWDVDE